jgi:putative endonuclease
MPYYVYILYSAKCDRYYIGYSENPEKRLHERHNKGIVNATKHCLPYELQKKKGYNLEIEARGEELRIKKMKVEHT